MDRLSEYRQAAAPLPDIYWLWPLYDKGFENLGLEGRPIEVPLPSCGPDELLVEQGALDTNRTVAAISGLDSVYDDIYAVSQGQFPGKVVVYPHITGLGLIPLPEVRDRLPEVYAKLGPGGVWTAEAEEALQRLQL